MLAIVQQVGSPERIYWLRAVPDNASPFGPWINPNQFAGFMEMMSPLALSLFLFYRPRLHGRESLREKVVNFFTMPGSNLYLFLGCAATLMVRPSPRRAGGTAARARPGPAPGGGRSGRR